MFNFYKLKHSHEFAYSISDYNNSSIVSDNSNMLNDISNYNYFNANNTFSDPYIDIFMHSKMLAYLADTYNIIFIALVGSRSITADIADINSDYDILICADITTINTTYSCLSQDGIMMSIMNKPLHWYIMPYNLLLNMRDDLSAGAYIALSKVAVTDIFYIANPNKTKYLFSNESNFYKLQNIAILKWCFRKWHLIQNFKNMCVEPTLYNINLKIILALCFVAKQLKVISYNKSCTLAIKYTEGLLTDSASITYLCKLAADVFNELRCAESDAFNTNLLNY